MTNVVAQPGVDAQTQETGSTPEHLTARLTALTPWLPVCVSAGIVGVVTIRGDLPSQLDALIASAVGVCIGLAVWVAMALLTQGTALPWEANPRVYRDLQDRTWRLEVEIGKLSQPDTLPQRLGLLKGGFVPAKVDASWSTGVAYILQWRLVHELERAVMAFHDAPALRADLAHDEARIEGSSLDRQGSATRKALDDARDLLARQQPDEAGAKALLLDVRDTVNNYRDASLWQLIEERIEIDRRTTALGFIAVAILALSIAFEAPAEAVGSVALYYLVGMAVALLAQLEKRRHDASVVEMYGYGAARLRQVLQVAGLAATSGVAVVWLVGTGASADLTMHELTHALIATPANVLIAAAFGLAPGMLFERVSGLALKSIEALESTTKGADGGAGK
jgi:hypothetical protein